MADPTPADVREFIAAGLPCTHIEIEGDAGTSSPPSSRPSSKGLARVRRHQRVYAALRDRMREQIHAVVDEDAHAAEFAAEAHHPH